ncbi:hypothetical protein [Sphingomonas sp. MS122]|uniref:hypothetical protein n=1 Tax=Sphingomonas sp. MS122 TaxID=3412683 RepID=UPI003C2F5DDE
MAPDKPDLAGPGRFCGYSPIIDLLPGERVTLGNGGMHGGSFRWEGEFGVLDVHGIGWASRPKGGATKQPTSKGHVRFREKREGKHYVVAIWNGRHGAAYFRSDRPLSNAQLKAIDRVGLFDENDASPTGCDFRDGVVVT